MHSFDRSLFMKNIPVLPALSLAQGLHLAGEPSRRRGLHRVGCLFTFLVVFLLGLLLGGAGLLLALSHFEADRSPLAVPAQPASAAIVIQLSSTYLSQMINKNVKSSGLPGTILSTRVSLVHNEPITMTGNDQLQIFGFTTTKRFTLQLQPLVRSCMLQVHVLHADLEGISITSFAATMETSINQQLQVNTSGFPRGFTYCMTGVRTEQEGLFISYSAQTA